MIAIPLLALALAAAHAVPTDGHGSPPAPSAPPALPALPALPARGSSAEATTPTAPAKAERVGGDVDAVVEWRDDTWRYDSMRIEAPLPEGYPQPTPPGAVEIKRYPSVRRAEFVGRGNSDLGMNLGFWPLFQHIKKREIAMTSPVEMDYRGGTTSGPAPAEDAGANEAPAGGASDRAWTMSFLYRTPDLGPIGDDGKVRVVDTEPVTVLAIGLRGPYRLASISEGVDALKAWLANHPEWELSDDPRALYYNGPEIRNADKWSEAQLPIRVRPIPAPSPS